MDNSPPARKPGRLSLPAGSVRKPAPQPDRAPRAAKNAPPPKPRSNVYHAPPAPKAGVASVRPTVARAEPQPVRPAAPADGSSRLNKRMAEMGLCSRREADEWIANGWVRVNGEVAQMGQRVLPQDAIRVDRRANEQKSSQVTFLLHKPVGYVSAQAEDGHTPAASLLTAENRWREDASPVRFHPSQWRGLAPAGRLDIDSTGLLVLTQDGVVARQIIGEHSEIDKEYLVRVEYASPQGMVQQNVQGVFPARSLALLRHGLSLDEQPLLPAEVTWQNPEQLRFVLREGKKRQIRRMCEQVGLHVVGLKRIRIGRVLLGNLPKGQWRYLAEDERF